MPKPKKNPADEIETLVKEGKADIAAKLQMQVQMTQGRVAWAALVVGLAILALTVVLVVLTAVLIARTH
jgi:hypothetical protein